MSRIRTIKPEFPQSETIGRLSRDARLLFVLLWTIADDAGRARAASRMLASLLYPYDDDAPNLIERWLTELERAKCIRRYDVDGARYLEIVNWLKHQKIDRPSKSRLPAFDEGSPSPREDSRAFDADLGPGPGPGPTPVGSGDPTNDQSAIKAVRDSGKPKPRRIYPGAFQKFWDGYPTDANMSKKEAFTEWNKLCEEDQIAAIASLPAYRKHCEANASWYRPKHAAGYLKGRRWEGFADKAKAEAEQKAKKFVHHSEFRHQFDAWYLHFLFAGDREAICGMNSAAQWNRRYPVPTDWPPDYDADSSFPLQYAHSQASPRQNAWDDYFKTHDGTFMNEALWRREINLPTEYPPGYQPATSIAA